MGDTLWGTPAIRAIKKKLPDAMWDTPTLNNDRKIQIPSNGTHMDIILSTDEKKEANFFLEKHGTRSKEFIYLNIGGSVSYKQWPVDQFIALSNPILNDTLLKLFLEADLKIQIG